MSNINELILYEVRLHFDCNKFDRNDLDHIQHLLHKNGVHFDYGHDLHHNVRDWELDWSLSGPMYTSPSNDKDHHHTLPEHLQYHSPKLKSIKESVLKFDCKKMKNCRELKAIEHALARNGIRINKAHDKRTNEHYWDIADSDRVKNV